VAKFKEPPPDPAPNHLLWPPAPGADLPAWVRDREQWHRAHAADNGTSALGDWCDLAEARHAARMLATGTDLAVPLPEIWSARWQDRPGWLR
jgi:hypothetical protein